ncbi:LegC family aminotransferase [Algoriphagus lutimaris]|uniref:LegC family aminotransferase n=1 Tax=Algoriphagus lutimaris TaxID=613197 RepID=UPI00196A8971|nr:LegC family aminotransferase [Algoriphagus lutimaris]MBN3518667.1 LegC family aminotransferase [Algoriphagus lutimaris]
MVFKETIQFIQDKFNTKDFIPLHVPHFNGNERKYVLDTLDSTFVSSVGAYVDRGEAMMTEISQTKGAVAVVNGTAGLQVALQLVGVKPGEEVLTQALTFVATTNAIQYNGAQPIFLDVDYDTMGLSPKSVLDFLEEFGERRDKGTFNKKSGKRIAACLPMHTFGFPVHLEELLAVCKDWNIPIVEDAAESLGSSYKGKPTGSFGKVGVFSFNGNKIVTSGGGGMIVTNDEKLGKLGKHLTTTAKIPHAFEYFHDQTGYNFRMPNLNAALLCAQLEQLRSFLENKRKLAGDYAEFFENQGITFRKELENTKANYWLMCVEMENLEHRNSFLEVTNGSKVMTRPIWQLMFRLPMYAHCQRDAQTNAEFLEQRIVNIPSSAI